MNIKFFFKVGHLLSKGLMESTGLVGFYMIGWFLHVYILLRIFFTKESYVKLLEEILC
jgi:hypothetical protein